MKLHEAIRLGSMLRPQNHGDLYAERTRGILGLTTERMASCALGAAYEAAGVEPFIRTVAKGELLSGFRGQMAIADGHETVISYPDPWYAFVQTIQPCPACTKYDALELHRLIPHLNDRHKWARERIADWVQSIEEAHEQSSVAVPVLVKAGVV